MDVKHQHHSLNIRDIYCLAAEVADCIKADMGRAGQGQGRHTRGRHQDNSEGTSKSSSSSQLTSNFASSSSNHAQYRSREHAKKQPPKNGIATSNKVSFGGKAPGTQSKEHHPISRHVPSGYNRYNMTTAHRNPIIRKRSSRYLPLGGLRNTGWITP